MGNPVEYACSCVDLIIFFSLYSCSVMRKSYFHPAGDVLCILVEPGKVVP